MEQAPEHVSLLTSIFEAVSGGGGLVDHTLIGRFYTRGRIFLLDELGQTFVVMRLLF